eukprot:CAMPEP_0118855340 /NCGR_PEP_ID=MMETSP1163-20130328/3207_1 /TAXON_ID=124430 /ORGANISM="Phaeomonas parva, Strain CCMP2877" /LENGTH=110 /DNA_ID=CAMNT_0006788217 /DNA_START=180 /DNA_END=512 /DNA_ORIENTATION=+
MKIVALAALIALALTPVANAFATWRAPAVSPLTALRALGEASDATSFPQELGSGLRSGRKSMWTGMKWNMDTQQWERSDELEVKTLKTSVQPKVVKLAPPKKVMSDELAL